MHQKLRTGEPKQSRTEIGKGSSFVYLDIFVKLVFGQNDIVYIEIVSPLIMKSTSLAIFEW